MLIRHCFAMTPSPARGEGAATQLAGKEAAMIANARTVLRDLFAAAVAAASPAGCVPQNLPQRPRGRTIVVGAGKAAAAMASAVEHHWDAPLEGLVVTRYGHGVPCARIRVVEAGHPV